MADDDEGSAGFGVNLPPALVRRMAEQHDRAHMQAEERAVRVYRLLDTLDAEQLLTLRFILNSPPDDSYAVNQYVDGQIVSILRLTHRVDPDTGEDPTAGLLGAPED